MGGKPAAGIAAAGRNSGKRLEVMSPKSGSGSNAAGIMYAVIAFTAWGFLPLYWHSLNKVPAAEILAHRILWSFVFSGSLLIIYGRWKNVRELISGRSGIPAILLSSVLISANWFIYIWAINNNHVVETSLGYYINPLFNVFLGVVVLGERLNSWQAASLVTAFLGVTVLTVEYGKVPWIALCLALTFGLYGLVKKLTVLDSLTGLVLETLLVAPAAVFYLMNKHFQGTAALGTAATGTVILLILSGVVTALPLLWFAQAAKLIPLSTVGFAQYLSPSITLVLGILVFHEPFTKAEAISFGLIWAALFLYSVSKTAIKDISLFSLQRKGPAS